MSLIHFVNSQPPQSLENFITVFKDEIADGGPFGMGAVIIPAHQYISHEVVFRLGFYQLSQPPMKDRSFCEIKDSTIFTTVKTNDETIEGVEKVMNEKMTEKVSDLLTREILQKDPDLKELKHLKIEILSNRLSLVSLFATTIKVDWTQNKPNFEFSFQILDKNIIDSNRRANYLRQTPISDVQTKSHPYFKAFLGGLFVLTAFLVARVVLKQENVAQITAFRNQLFANYNYYYKKIVQLSRLNSYR